MITASLTRIVIDLEWNQPLAGRTHIPGFYGEIIQIGAAKIDENCNVTDTFSIVIKPVHYKKINNALADMLSTVAVLKHLDLEEGLNDEYFLC